MVKFGTTLRNVEANNGWDGVYLDYDGLKGILLEIEQHLQYYDENEDQFTEDEKQLLNVHQPTLHEEFDKDVAVGTGTPFSPPKSTDRLVHLKEQFFMYLKREIEKVTLFALKKQGQLADAVGALRFQHILQFSQENTLAMTNTTSYHRNDLDLDLEGYMTLAIEVVNILKFICINSVGVQKILKKYNKAYERADRPHFYILESEHLKQLANSQSMVAINASLQSILEECIQSVNSMEEPTKTLDVMRLQSIMACGTVLQQNTKIFQFPFVESLSKQSMIVTQTNLGGMDGRGQRALKWMVELDPSTLRTMNYFQLEETWHRWSAETEMIHAFLDDDSLLNLRRPPSKTSVTTEIQRVTEQKDSSSPKWAWGGASNPTMFLNLFSILFYTVNYYIIAPTANHYAMGLGKDGAYGATLIGASSVSAMLAAFLYSMWYTQSTFKSALIFSTICAIFGNLLYSLAISYQSLTMAIFGRFLCGFGSAEVLNRQLISMCVGYDTMTKASALFVAFGASGMSIGPLIAAILDMTAGRDYRVDLRIPWLIPSGGIIYNHVTAPGFVMAALWSILLCFIVIFFKEPHRINGVEKSTEVHANTEIEYGSISSTPDKIKHFPSSQCIGPSGLWQELRSTYALVFEHAGFPLTLLIFSYIEMSDELIISSCSMIVRRYFGWHGSVAGFFIASLGALVIPAHFVVELASRHISERRILLRSCYAIIVSTIGIFNYSGLMYDILGGLAYNNNMPTHAADLHGTKLNNTKIKHILTPEGEIFYDWGFGIPIYMVFLSFLFMSTIILESVDTSIMAKVTPPKLNESFINGGLLATLIGTLGRVVADSILTASALLDINVFVDFVNATFLLVLLLGLFITYLAQKYYKSFV